MRAARQFLIAAGRWLAGVLLAGFLAAALLYLAPGASVDERELDPTLAEDVRATFRRQSAAPGNMLGFYAAFLNSAAHGDLGLSQTYGIPVTQLIGERWKLTASSVAQAWTAAWLLGLSSALLCSGWRWTAPPFTVFSSVLVCLPSGLLAIFFFVSGLPVSGILAAAVYPKEAWRAHSTQPWRAARPAAIELLRSFDLPCTEDFLHRFPSQVSVGQAQRILISMALLHRPALLIADEVTSAVDLLTQREVLSSLRRANTEWGTAVLHITHNLLSVPELCRDIVVLEKGLVVESGPCLQVLSEPVHPYTRRLIEALPAIHRRPAPLHQQPAGAAVRS